MSKLKGFPAGPGGPGGPSAPSGPRCPGTPGSPWGTHTHTHSSSDVTSYEISDSISVAKYLPQHCDHDHLKEITFGPMIPGKPASPCQKTQDVFTTPSRKQLPPQFGTAHDDIFSLNRNDQWKVIIGPLKFLCIIIIKLHFQRYPERITENTELNND